MNDLSQFTNCYPVSKTLRFKLIPQGRTLEYIEKRGLLEEDEHRAESYKLMKKTIDEYHKWFISQAMEHVVLSELDTYHRLYTASAEEKKDPKWAKEFEACQKALRKQVVAGFKSNEVKAIYAKLDKKELIKDLLPEWLGDEHDEFFTNEFDSFTTYFTGFHENRRNMYSDEEKSTAISYRLIHDNLPKHIDNMLTYQKVIKTEVADTFPEIYRAFEAYLNVVKLDDLFTLSYYNELLTQTQIEAYNLVIGGKAIDEKHRIQGLNEYINLYNQKNPEQKLPRFKMLYKQILSDRERISFLPDMFSDISELLTAVDIFYTEQLCSMSGINVLSELRYTLSRLTECDLSHIYVRNGRAVSDISQAIFGNYSILSSALEYREELFPAKNKKQQKPEYYSVAHLESCLADYIRHLKDEGETIPPEMETAHPVSSYFDNEAPFEEVKLLFEPVHALAQKKYGKGDRLDRKEKEQLKLFLDKVIELERYVKVLSVTSNRYSDKDANFYSSFEPLLKELDLIVPLYNKVRNYMTRKPYSTEKYKLNFQSPTLLNGWDVNKETSNLSVLFRKDDLFYLGIIDKGDTKAIEKLSQTNESDCYEKVEYKLLPGPNKMLPKVFFSKKNIDDYAPDDNILRIRNEETFKKGEQFSLEDCHTFIDFYKESIGKHPDWSQFGFDFSPTEQYDDISGFYREVEHQGYKITYKRIAEKDIDQLVDEGKLYLFQIYNKDFSPNSSGKPNLHTIYWKALFDEVNLNDVVYKLNGQAEIFYRKASISQSDKVVHPANLPIKNKNPHNQKETSQFDYDITKDRRYTMDQFQFHVPITMNFKATGNPRMNQQVREYLKNNPDVNIIGIDRGERHLLYVSVINQKGEILRDANGAPLQLSLNDIVSTHKRDGETITVSTPYHDMLDAREKEREKARESWETIEGIKELKEGYISQVISLISRWMVEYNAIVVLEDLNFGFKRGRFKVEKQVYQKFEKMLIDKLNYLVFKDIPETEIGGTYHALQLTEAFTSFRSLGKQSGFLFYVPAWNTSKMDPVTGFVNLFPKPKTVSEKKQFFKKFDSISFDGNDFCFSFNYDRFTDKCKGTRRKWTVSTQGGVRYYWSRKENNGKGGDIKIDLTEAIAALLNKESVEYRSGRDLREDIAAFSGESISALMHYFNILMKMRYSSAADQVDFILSPVANSDGVFYDSRCCDDSLPKDADANGAFNIARKGLWILQQINQEDNVMDARLAISNEEWLQFIQEG